MSVHHSTPISKSCGWVKCVVVISYVAQMVILIVPVTKRLRSCSRASSLSHTVKALRSSVKTEVSIVSNALLFCKGLSASATCLGRKRSSASSSLSLLSCTLMHSSKFLKSTCRYMLYSDILSSSPALLDTSAGVWHKWEMLEHNDRSVLNI